VTPYELEVRDDVNGRAVVELAGELDLTNVADVERRLEEIRSDRLALDLNRVAFVDSAALHMLFRTARRVGPEHRLEIVLDPAALVARTLRIVDIEKVATIVPTVEQLAAD
jgi:anti-anti-sigma factor